MTPRPRPLVLLLAVALGTACTLGPDPTVRPETVADGAAGYVHAPEPSPAATAREAAGAIDRWWLALADPVTADLVERALAANPDLAAAARVAQAGASLRAARGSRLPRVEASLSASRQKSSFVLPTVGRVGIFSTTLSDELSVSYQLDLFGRLARSRQAAWAELLAARADRETVLHSLVAGVVRARVAIATHRRLLELARADVESWEQSLELVERRYRNGLVGPLDVRLTRQSLAAARAAVPELELSLAQARQALDVLLARQPGTGPELPETLPELPGLSPPPPGLPVELMERRPDLEAAEMRLSAATARVGVALAELFPNLTLTGGVGQRGNRLDDLTSSDTLVYNAVLNLLAPIFTGGRLQAGVEGARARAEEAAALYADAVLTALREVEDALVADEARHRRVEALELSAQEARAASRLAHSRYEQGTGGLLAFLEAERRRIAAENQLLAARGAVWNARIDLHLALGGAWSTDPAAIESAEGSSS